MIIASIDCFGCCRHRWKPAGVRNSRDQLDVDPSTSNKLPMLLTMSLFFPVMGCCWRWIVGLQCCFSLIVDYQWCGVKLRLILLVTCDKEAAEDLATISITCSFSNMTSLLMEAKYLEKLVFVFDNVCFAWMDRINSTKQKKANDWRLRTQSRCKRLLNYVFILCMVVWWPTNWRLLFRYVVKRRQLFYVG